MLQHHDLVAKLLLVCQSHIRMMMFYSLPNEVNWKIEQRSVLAKDAL